ncbi:MAG TPA: hypothetical protein VFE84_08970, partial [Patescibacteria group bacterium]|nr:hypothetical protein [Patescibacteria group bacterium]
MSRSRVVRVLKLSAVLFALCASGPVSAQAAKKAPQFTDDFRLQDCTFSSVGANPYFIVQPGYQTVFKGLEDGVAVVNTITVLNQTLELGGVETRVIEERETHDGQLAEVSLNYFAICTETNSVFYFGEDVDIYDGGVIVAHDGTWHHG